ncbi:hypothetical protein IFR05_014524 [Cadophora sp. M221]|nr:hypothetical protein IFR05_014524 [Cadophora sp. M221]
MFLHLTALSGAALVGTVLAITPEAIPGFRITFCLGSDDFKASTLRAGKWDRFTAKAGGQMIVQARFKLGEPGARLQGIWPAFWSLGEAIRHGVDWPDCGEIDTIENVNGEPLGYGTIHCAAACTEQTALKHGVAFDQGTFHTWAHAIDLRNNNWRKQSITWYMNGQSFRILYGGDINDEDAWKSIAQKGMFIILNVAVGGNWPGNVATDTVSGKAASMEVQYVAVYESV